MLHDGFRDHPVQCALGKDDVRGVHSIHDQYFEQKRLAIHGVEMSDASDERFQLDRPSTAQVDACRAETVHGDEDVTLNNQGLALVSTLPEHRVCQLPSAREDTGVEDRQAVVVAVRDEAAGGDDEARRRRAEGDAKLAIKRTYKSRPGCFELRRLEAP
jgi:hypothetical protein